jgi:hypothetical protein
MNGCRILVGYLKAAMNVIVRVNRMDSTRKVKQVFNNNPQGIRLRGRPKTDGGTMYKHILIKMQS